MGYSGEDPSTGTGSNGGRRGTVVRFVTLGLAAWIVAAVVLFAQLLLLSWLFGGGPAVPLARSEALGVAVVFAVLYLVNPVGVFLALIPVLRYVARSSRPVLVAAFTVLAWLLLGQLVHVPWGILGRYVPEPVLSGAYLAVIAVGSFALLEWRRSRPRHRA